MKKNFSIKLVDISAFSKEGFGKGVFDGGEKGAVLVETPFTVPGDKAEVALISKKKGVFQGKLHHLQHPSPKRVSPVCAHFGSCGGCKWQNVDYVEQLKVKEAWVLEKLEPLFNSATQFSPIIPSDLNYRYRNKLELSFSSDKAGHCYLGLIMLGTRGHVFQMQECHLMNPWAAEVALAVQDWWQRWGLLAYHCTKNEGSLRTLTLREGIRTKDRLIMLTVSSDPRFAIDKRALHDFVATCRLASEASANEGRLSIFLRLQQIAKGKPTQFYEMLLHGADHIRETLLIESREGYCDSLNFKVSPSAFFQPNTYQAEKLYSKAIQLTGVTAQDTVFDLYCGTGTLGICMAKSAKEVVGIELCRESSCDARENVKCNHMENVCIHTGDVGKLLPQIISNGQEKPNIIMVDPPRSGLDSKAIDHILSVRPEKLTYISCNPATQAENCTAFVQNGYRIAAVQSVDQFPHTHHVENIVALRLT